MSKTGAARNERKRGTTKMKHNNSFHYFKNMIIPKSRKGWIIRISLLCVFLLLFWAYRLLDCFLDGMYPNSDSATILAAQKRGVLLYVYKITPGSFTLPDGSKVSFKEVWVEKGWGYTNVCKNEFELIPDAYFFNITFNGEQIDKMNRLYGYTWVFVRGNEKLYQKTTGGDGKGNDKIKMAEDVAYPTDTLRLIINSGPALSKETERVEQTFVVQKVTD